MLSTPSTCDSRNLNLSPFCNLTSTSLAMWQPTVLETYGNLTTTYINKTTGPLRPKYPGSMGDRELISSLTKVCWPILAQTKPHSNIRTKQTTMPTRRTSPLWTSSLENQMYLVSCNPTKTNRKPMMRCFIPEFERLPKMTWLDFVSGFGGLCGLCLGISFVSLAEILYWFSIKLCRNLIIGDKK